MIALKIVGFSEFCDDDYVGMYIKSFDPNSPDPESKGIGKLIVTENASEAKTFETFGEATEFWRQQSPTVPMRSDGKPNRPLTAYSVQFVSVP